MSEIMSPREFKYGLLKIARADPGPRSLIDAETYARRLAARYIDADDDAKRDCSRMLREDLQELSSRGTGDE